MGEYLASVKKFYITRPRVATAATMGVATVLYLLGLKLFLVPAALVCMALYLPFPKVFRSLFSRLVTGLFLFYGLMLLAMLGQMMLFPDSDFKVPAAMSALLVAGVVYAAARFRKQDKLAWVSRSDIAGIAAVLVFAVPCAVGVGLKSGVNGIAGFGGIQSGDGTSHFSMQLELGSSEHLRYKRGPNYYPKGFHYNTVFVLDSVGLNPHDNGWTKDVYLYAMEYVVLGSLTMYTLFYLGRFLADRLADKGRRLSDMWLALAIGPTLSAVLLLPFVYEGFLNFTYVLGTFAVALVYLGAAFYGGDAASKPEKRLYLLAYLLLIFGVSMSWNLLVPPLLLVPLFVLLPDKITPQTMRQSLGGLFSKSNLVVVFGFLVQFVPFVLQFKYATFSSQTWYAAEGSIRIFHIGLVIAGLGIATYAVLNKQFGDGIRRFLANVFLSLNLFVLGLACLQYFLVGDIRYYTIKSSYILEALVIVLAAVLLLHAFDNKKIGWLQSRVLPLLLVFMGSLLLIGLTANPLQTVRLMFREYSHYGYPEYYDSDVRGVAGVTGGKKFDSNVTVVHYDAATGKLFGNILIPNWATTVWHPTSLAESDNRNCRNELHDWMFYHDVSEEQQSAIRKKINDCAQIAKKYGGQLKIVTDKNSVPYLQQLSGDSVKLVYEQ